MIDFDAQVLGGERGRYATSPHPATLYVTLVWRLLALLGVYLVHRAGASEAVARFLAQPGLSDLGGAQVLPRWLDWACMLAAVALVAVGMFDYLRWHATRFLLTDTRVIKLSGIFERTAVETPLERVDDLLVSQGLLGRRFDYGDLVMLRAIEGGGVVLAHMEAPHAFKKRLQAARAVRLERILQAALASGAGTPSASSATQPRAATPRPRGLSA